MFHSPLYTCTFALIVYLFPMVEVTTGDESLRKSDGALKELRVNFAPLFRENLTGRNVTEKRLIKEGGSTNTGNEVEFRVVGIPDQWLESINPWTDETDCCFGHEPDCNLNCTMVMADCNLSCGYLLLPKNSTVNESLTTHLHGTSGTRIRLRVSVFDLRAEDNITIFNKLDAKPLDTITCDSFTSNQMEKYFVSDKEDLFVSYEMMAQTKGEGCGGLEDPSGKLQFEALKEVECNTLISEDADGNLFGHIMSSKYYPSLRDCKWIIQSSSPGYGIELLVKEFDLNAVYGDYIQVNPGTTKKSKGYIMTWSNTESQYSFQVVSGGSATVSFHSGLHLSPNKHKGFHIVYKHYGNGTVPDSTTSMGPPLPTPIIGEHVNYALYIAGKTPEQFNSDKHNFMKSLATISNHFCQEENIHLLEPISFQDVVIHSIMHCPATWPYSHTCVELIIQIVARTVSGEYELTESNLQKMWERYGLDRNITQDGIWPYQRDPDVFTWWLAGILTALTIFIILLMVTWYCRKNPLHTSQKIMEKEPITTDEKKTEPTGLKYPNPPFRIIEEEDEDDEISYTSDYQDSSIGYDTAPGSSIYIGYNDGIGSHSLGGHLNPAYTHDDELDDIDLNKDNFKFQFSGNHLNSRIGSSQRCFSTQQRVLQIEKNTDIGQSETVL